MSGRQWVRSAPSGPLGALGGGMAGEGPLSTEGKACGCHGALTTREGVWRPGASQLLQRSRSGQDSLPPAPRACLQESPASTESAEQSRPLLQFPDGGIPPHASEPGNGGAGCGGALGWQVSMGDGGPGGKALLHKPMLILPSAPRPPEGPEASDQERTSADSSGHCSGPQLTLMPEHPGRHSVHQTPRGSRGGGQGHPGLAPGPECLRSAATRAPPVP